MSEMKVTLQRVVNVRTHPNADALDIITVLGWETIVKRGEFSVGDIVVYFPPDAVLTSELANKLGVAKYLKQVDDTHGRVYAARLRGEPSYGFVAQPENCDLQYEDGTWVGQQSIFFVGDDLTEYLSVTKYEPPARTGEGDEARENSAFFRYGGIENIGNYPNMFTEGEPVVFTEKIHGSNCRLGIVKTMTENGKVWEFAAGSNSVQRKEFDLMGHKSDYWVPLDEKVRHFLDDMTSNDEVFIPSMSVVLYGEIYGAGVQDLKYGLNNKSFRAFDISIDGKYVPYNKFCELMDRYNIERVPELYRGPYSYDLAKEYAHGKSTLKGAENQIREGIVIKGLEESRKILKFISSDYLSRKNGTEYH